MQTRNITMPYEIGSYGGVQQTSCWAPCYDGNCMRNYNIMRELHDLLLPDGITASEVSVSNGHETMYVLKATNIYQVVPAAKDQSACDVVQLPPAGYAIPDISLFGTMIMPAMPDKTKLELKAVNGEVLPKYRKTQAPAPAPGTVNGPPSAKL